MKKILVGAAMVAVGATSWFGSAPAHAMSADAVCNSGEMCIFYNSAAHGYGSFADWDGEDPSFAGHNDRFLSSGAGQGSPVANHAAHAWNRRNQDARIYYNSYYGGAYDNVGAVSRRDLGVTKNENASFKWI